MLGKLFASPRPATKHVPVYTCFQVVQLELQDGKGLVVVGAFEPTTVYETAQAQLCDCAAYNERNSRAWVVLMMGMCAGKWVVLHERRSICTVNI